MAPSSTASVPLSRLGATLPKVSRILDGLRRLHSRLRVPSDGSSFVPRPSELNKDPQEVIDATHGRRATDNLKDLKPELADTPDSEMAPHVQEFEEKILEAADEFQKEVRSRRESMAEEIVRVAAIRLITSLSACPDHPECVAVNSASAAPTRGEVLKLLLDAARSPTRPRQATLQAASLPSQRK